MSTYSLKRTQILSTTLDHAWDFFSDPAKLNEITPAYMDFKILSNSGEGRIFAGQIITYTVKPLLKIPLFWMTEITHVKDREYFVDEQRFGPYAFWHHTHFFKEVPAGVEMTDVVHYKLPLGFAGRLGKGLVTKKLEGLFDHRYEVLEKKIW
ncbi:MAG: SRPBCC family protein [Chitinophagaceae bacterium]